MESTAIVRTELNLGNFLLGQREFKPGDRVVARVLQSDGQGNISIDLGRFNAKAKVEFPIQTGQILNLVVRNTIPRLVLQLAPDRTGAQPGLQSSPQSEAQRMHQTGGTTGSQALKIATPPPPPLPSGQAWPVLEKVVTTLWTALQANSAAAGPPPQPVIAAAERFVEMTKAAVINDDPSQLTEKLSDVIKNSGFFFEKHLEGALEKILKEEPDIKLESLVRHPDIEKIFERDLKPNLALLEQHLDQAGGKKAEPQVQAAVEELQRTTKHLMGQLDEHMDRLSQQIVKSDTPSQVTEPMIWYLNSDQGAVKLKLYHPPKSPEGEAAPIRVALLLDMDRLGSMRSDLSVSSGTLRVTFFLKTAGARDAVLAHLPEIRSALEVIYPSTFIEAVVSDDRITQFETEQWVMDSARTIDVRI